jgi:saccharopine dehydrogenase-like NADP-dependent oxidoreductase
LSSVPHEDPAGESQKSAAVMEVKGTLDGVDQLIRISLTGNMAPLTALPAAIGAELLARGEITETGVMPPEACVPPQAVLQPMADTGIAEISEELITFECAELTVA